MECAGGVQQIVIMFLRMPTSGTPQAEFSKSWRCSCACTHHAHRKQSSADHDRALWSKHAQHTASRVQQIMIVFRCHGRALTMILVQQIM